MEKKLIQQKVKEILISVLNLKKKVEEITDEQVLFGNDQHPGLFDDSLAVLEVTSVLMSEFDIEASVFNEDSFKTVDTLVDCIYNALQAVAVK